MKRLNEIKSTVENMREWWSATTTVYVDPKDRPEGQPDAWSRVRRPEEYPEAQRLYWHGTVAGIDKMISDLYALRELCVEEYNKTPE